MGAVSREQQQDSLNKVCEIISGAISILHRILQIECINIALNTCASSAIEMKCFPYVSSLLHQHIPVLGV